ncbi:MAG: D-alanyl-D-alanine carboxypeptidase/D-alanyl-D-alanine-endopeptidase [Bacteroidales bacterium]|nr:D-alanyl-D-alanine carboxypeptidase/D-alanyl-D-alanine-endopeptidase [Bacteroidales bacterium]
MKKILFSVLILLGMVSYGFAQGGAQNYINRHMKTDPNFRNAVIAILAVDEKGNTIAEWNSEMPLLTASTMKTISTGVGMHVLGKDFKYKTQVAYTGNIKDGVLEGDVVIIGGGDPTLGSKDTIAFSIDSIFGIWTDAIKGAGITRVEGNVVVDDSYFVREQMPDSWSWGNFGASYGCAPSGLSFHENRQQFKLTAGKEVGDPVIVKAIYPHVPGLEVVNQMTTGEAGTGNRSAYYVQDMVCASQYAGTLAVDRKPVYETNSNRFPHLSCGFHFREHLVKNGIDVLAEIIDAKDYGCKAERNVVAETYSPELWKIVEVTNRISNNMYAETILKTIGKELTGSGSYDSSFVALERVLVDMGVNTTGFTQEDGSGLSRQNYVSPKFFCNYYDKMQESGIFAEFFNSLPVPGRPGTLKSVLKDADQKLKDRIHAKSGSLANVRCYAGYVQGSRKYGLVRFAILTNNFAVPTSTMMPKIEGFMKSLAQW